MLNSGMKKGGYVYKIDYITTISDNFTELLKGYAPGALLIYNENEYFRGLFTPSFDPVDELTSTLGMYGELVRMLRMMAKEIESKDTRILKDSYKISREGSKVKIIHYSAAGNNGCCCCSGKQECKTDSNTKPPDTPVTFDKRFFNVYVFDLKKGCSLVETHNRGRNSESREVIDYEEHEGVFVPNKITTSLVSEKPPSVNTSRNITITTKTINTKIPPSEFQYEQLGLRPGDEIVDHSAGGRRYKWESPDNIEDVVKSVWGSIIRDVEESVPPKNDIEQTPKIDAKATTSSAAK
jgi:hypothetical protein